jgi:hypothetical protein
VAGDFASGGGAVKTANAIADVILRVLHARGLTVVRAADTTFGSDMQDMDFAIDCANHAETALQRGDEWRPADGRAS